MTAPGVETPPASEGLSLASVNAETSVVGAFLIGGDRDQEALDRAQAALEPWMFTRRDLRAVYSTAVRLREQGERPDVLTVSEALKDSGKLEEAGGFDLLASLVDAVPTAANVEQHAGVVARYASRRRYRSTLKAGLRDVEDMERSLPDLLEDQRERLEVLQQAEGGRVRVVTLAEILADPDALKPPPAVVPRLAWAGRVTLLAAREKLGKSTLASAAAAAKTQGAPIFGQLPELGGVLYIGLEEHRGDLARRLADFGAHPHRVSILDRVGSPLSDLESAVAGVQPSLTIVDTLAALVESMDLDPGSSSAWVPVMLRLARIARDSGTGMLILHHANKSTGEYRDSTAIGGGVDAIVTMRAGDIEGSRKFSAVGRWAMDDFAARLVERSERQPAHFALSSGEPSLDAQVVAFVARNPGASSRKVRTGVKGRTEDISTAINRLLRTGAIEDRGAGTGFSLHLRDGDPTGTTTEPPRNHPGTGSGNHGAEVVPQGGSPPKGEPLGTAPGTDPTELLEGGEA